MLEDADGADHLASLANFILARDTGAEVAGITNDHVGLDRLFTAAHTHKLACLRIDNDLVDGFVEHVGTAVDGRKTSKGLRKLSKTVERVDVGRLAVTRHGRGVEYDAVVCLTSGALKVGIVEVKCHRVADEVLRTGLKTKVIEDLDHGVRVEVEALVGGRVRVTPVLDEFEELFGPALLEQAHEGGSYGLHLGGGHLGDLSVSVDIRGGNLLEFEVSGHVGVDEHLCKLTIGHDEFGDEVDSPVAVAAPVFGGLGARTELFVELSEVKRGHFTTVHLAAVDVQHLFAIDGQEGGQDTFGHTGAEDNGVWGWKQKSSRGVQTSWTLARDCRDMVQSALYSPYFSSILLSSVRRDNDMIRGTLRSTRSRRGEPAAVALSSWLDRSGTVRERSVHNFGSDACACACYSLLHRTPTLRSTARNRCIVVLGLSFPM